MTFKPRFCQQVAQWFPVALGLGLLSASIVVIVQELRKYHVREVWHSLMAISPQYLMVALGLTVVNYLVFTGYDTLAVQYVRHPLPYRKTAIASIISTAISNSVGIALLSGSAIRYRLYTAWGFSNSQIAHIIAFCNLSFWLGMFAVGGVLFIIEPIALPSLLHLPFRSVHPLGWIFLSIILVYLIWNVRSQRPLRLGRVTFPNLPVWLSLAQIAITSLDWALAAAVLYVLLPATTPVSYPGFFGIYLLAQLAGVISNVPGGLGVFETVMLLLLCPPVPSNALFGALLAYRVIYYWFPLITAALMLGIYEIRQPHRPR